MITTAKLAIELNLKQRTIQERITRLGIRPQRVGSVFVLTPSQAQKVREARSQRGPIPKVRP